MYLNIICVRIWIQNVVIDVCVLMPVPLFACVPVMLEVDKTHTMHFFEVRHRSLHQVIDRVVVSVMYAYIVAFKTIRKDKIKMQMAK